MTKIPALAALFALASFAAQAQTLTSAKMEPAEVKVGEKTTLTADFQLNKENATNCRVTVNFGDGSPAQAFEINQRKDVPVVASHTYAKAGTYTVSVEPHTKMPYLKCLGKDQTAAVKVVAPPPPAAAAASAPAPGAAAAAPACPDGWKLDKKSVSKKTGAFTCTAKAGTAAPAGKLTCPGTLGYFENTKKGQLGCRP